MVVAAIKMFINIPWIFISIQGEGERGGGVRETILLKQTYLYERSKQVPFIFTSLLVLNARPLWCCDSSLERSCKDGANEVTAYGFIEENEKIAELPFNTAFIWSNGQQTLIRQLFQSSRPHCLLTLKAPIMTAADDSLEYVFIVFQRK